MKTNLKFSVILPAYNVEQDLRRSLESVEKQTYRNFEAIIIDDCATDRTGEIADDFVLSRMEEGKFRVIHKEKNEGLSEARNTGMSEAVGDYILFLDTDDFYEPDMLESLAESLEDCETDIVVFGFYEDYFDKRDKMQYQVVKSMPAKRWRGLRQGHSVEFCDSMVDLERETMYGYAWNKAYRLEYLREKRLRFENIAHIEDITFNIEAFEDVDSLTILEQRFYHYCNRNRRRLTGKYLENYFDLQKTRIIKFLEQQSRWRQINVEELDAKTLTCMANFYFRAYQSSIVRGIAHGDKRRNIIDKACKERESELYRLLCDHLNTDSRMAKLLYEPLRQGKLRRAYVMAYMICLVQRHFSTVYVKLKQNK